MRIYKTQKTVLSIENHPTAFLNGITSNDMDKPNNAFLSIHGKIVATFDQIKVSDDQYCLCIEKPFVKDVLSHIDRFVKLSGVRLEEKKCNVYFDLDSNADILDNDHVLEQKQGRLILTEREIKNTVSEEEFTLFRLKNNIPLHGVDYKDELLLNVSEVEFVSFTKGCYLGQEPISKVHSRSKPTWKLVVRNEEDCSEEEKLKMTSKIKNPENNKTMGFVFIKNSDNA